MPLMGSIYVGNSGLQTHQNALNTTAHNMSNMDTKGFVRQQALFGNSPYNTISVNAKAVANQQLGLGVTYTAARQVRDQFLDKSYRRESGRSAFYEVSFTSFSEVETLLGELKGEAFAESLDDLWYSVQELANVPEDVTNQGLFVRSCSAFVRRAQSVYQGLNDYQDNLNYQVKLTVDKINKYGNQIKILNDKISMIECGGIEHANDLRDVRNQLVDELSAMGKIECKEDAGGAVSIKFEGVPFVDRDVVYEMGLKADATTGFYTPFWPQNATFTYNDDGSRNYDITNGKVFNPRQEISSDINTDIGSLKSALLARGDHRGNYTDLLDKEHYNNDIAPSIIMNVQAEFDQLIHAVTTKINTILAEASDKKPGGYLSNPDGTPIQMFQRVNGSAWNDPEITDDPSRTDTLFSIANIIMNPLLEAEPALLGFMKEGVGADRETTDKIKKAFQEKAYSLNPNANKPSSFIDYYSDLVSQVGNSGSVSRHLMESQQQHVQITENARQGIMGVSTDEELSNMIRFQNGYNAASRYINAISEMLEHIINRLT